MPESSRIPPRPKFLGTQRHSQVHLPRDQEANALRRLLTTLIGTEVRDRHIYVGGKQSRMYGVRTRGEGQKVLVARRDIACSENGFSRLCDIAKHALNAPVCKS